MPYKLILFIVIYCGQNTRVCVACLFCPYFVQQNNDSNNDNYWTFYFMQKLYCGCYKHQKETLLSYKRITMYILGELTIVIKSTLSYKRLEHNYTLLPNIDQNVACTYELV